MLEKVTYTSDGIMIEGLLELRSEKGVVITHPHPLYGGDMRNPVVESVCMAFQRNGFSTFRFNFRGVGGSQGHYDGNNGEIRDVINAITFFSKAGVREIALAGYSFGAWVNAGISQYKAAVAEMIMVSPPVALMDFSAINKLPALKLVVSGSRDEISPADRIRRILPCWNAAASFEIIDGADHFYSGYLDTLTMVIDAHIRQ